jgi:hypothetical protein
VLRKAWYSSCLLILRLQKFTVVSNFTCSNEPLYPVKPKFIDYYIVDTANLLEGWTYLTRRTAPPVIDAFNLTVSSRHVCSALLVVTHTHTLKLPEGYWATGQVNYTLRALVTYPDPGHAGLIDTRPYDAVPLQIAGN